MVVAENLWKTGGLPLQWPAAAAKPSARRNHLVDQLTMPKEVDVAIGILVEPDSHGWRLLITRRPDTAILGGYWEFPGGKLETGETPGECLSREFAEEVGLTIEVGRPLPVIEHRYDHGHIRLHPFFCRRIDGELRNLHVAEHRWIRPGELKDYKFPPANEELMDAIRQMLSGDAATTDIL
jgi:8-oxo-dGTP diphosphatase